MTTFTEMKDSLPWKYYLNKTKQEIHALAPYVTGRWFLRVYRYTDNQFRLFKETTLTSDEEVAFLKVYSTGQRWVPLPPDVADRAVNKPPAGRAGDPGDGIK